MAVACALALSLCAHVSLVGTRNAPISLRPRMKLVAMAAAGDSTPNDSVPPSAADLSVRPTRADLREVVALAIPVLGTCLMAPLTTLTDTWTVGRLSPGGGSASSIGLGALEINSAVFRLVEGSFTFLSIAMTKVVGRAADRGERAQAHVARDGLALATIIGLTSALAIVGSGKRVLLGAFQLGEASELLAPSLMYLRVRAIALPPTIANYALSGICIALRRVPTLAYALPVLINLVGDVLLVPTMGLYGAVLATAVSSWAQLWLLLRHVSRHMDLTSGPWSLMSREDLRPFLSISGTALVVQLLNSFTWSSAGRGVALCADVSCIAMHQVLSEACYFLACVATPLSMAAQGLLPAAVSRCEVLRARRILASVVILAVALGLGGGAVIIGFGLGAPGALAEDAGVRVLLSRFAPLGALSVLANCVNSGLYGVYVGCGWLPRFFAMNVVSTLVAIAAFLSVPAARGGYTLGCAWAGIVGFCVLKCVLGLLQLPGLVSRTLPREQDVCMLKPELEEQYGLPGLEGTSAQPST